MRILLLLVGINILATPLVALAGETFVPITPIRVGGVDATSGSFAQYLNTVFRLALTIGALLAVVMIAVGGFEYIFSEATQSKHDGKLRITHALYGLSILLLVTLILYVINPSIICINLFEAAGRC